ncbi:MAG TPA: protein kinase [Gemmata sp.]|nr:protein kinase [Gemmata sp.]
MNPATNQPHPDVATLIAFHFGRLEANERAAIERHLALCQECSGRLAASVNSTDNSWTKQSSKTESPASGEEQAVIPPPLVDHPRYKVLERIGEGGMGVVYKAEHRVMGRIVALKVLTAGLSINPPAMDRFRREVRLASRLNHPNIVTAYDADEAGDLHFLVMEFVDGLSLDKLVSKRGPLHVQTACEFVRQAALGLQHAFAKGMIHRDIKPHNLMLAQTGQVKILDFGLARIADLTGADPASLTAMAITKPQTVMGTPDFCSPEQSRDPTSVDIRSDLYSLGCTFYYLLTGKPPFEGAGTYAKMIAHYKEPPPDIAKERKDIPGAVGDILQKLLSKSPSERFQTPAELSTDLQPFCGSGRIEDFKQLLAPLGQTTKTGFASDGLSAALPIATELNESTAVGTIVSPSTGLKKATPGPTANKGKRWVIKLVCLAIVVGGLAGLAVWMNGKKGESDEAVLEPLSLKTKHAGYHAPPNALEKVQSPRTKSVVEKNRVLLLIPSEFAQAECTTIINILKQRGFGYLTVGPDKNLLDGYQYSSGSKSFIRKYGTDYEVKEVSDSVIDSVDGVIVLAGEYRPFAPGGVVGGEIKRIIESSVKKKKVIGAVGSGVVVLGYHGFLDNRQVSALVNRPKSEAQIKVKAWVEDPTVVTDFPFVTSGVIGHAKEFTEEMVKVIVNESEE